MPMQDLTGIGGAPSGEMPEQDYTPVNDVPEAQPEGSETAQPPEELPARNVDPNISARNGGIKPTGVRLAKFTYATRGMEGQVPELEPHDQRLHDAYWFERWLRANEEIDAKEPERLEHRAKILANAGVSGTITVANPKGGAGKTRTTHLLLAGLRRYTGREVVGMLATGAQSTATLGLMADLPMEYWVSVVDFADRLRNPMNHFYDAMSELIPRTLHDNVGLLTELKTDVRTRRRLTPAMFALSVLRLKPNTGFLVLDQGNEDNEKDEIPTWAARLAHAIVAVYTEGDASTSRGVHDLMESLRVDWEHFDPRSLVELLGASAPNDLDLLMERTGLTIATATKVANAVVVTTKSSSSEPDRKRHARYTAPGQILGDTREVEPWRGRSAAVLLDSYLAGTFISEDGDEVPNPLIWDELDPQNQRAGLRLTVDALETLAENRCIRVPDTDKYRPTVIFDDYEGDYIPVNPNER